MPLTTAPQGFATGLKLFHQSAATSTAAVNLLNGPATLFHLFVDNTANAAITYVKLYNHASPTIGTTDPVEVYKVAASTAEYFYIPSGIVFSTALSVGAVTTGGTAGTTNPSSSVPLFLIASE